MDNCNPRLQKPNNGSLARTMLELQELSTTNLNAIALTLEVSLGASGTVVRTGSASYQVPPSEDLVIYQIQSAFRSNDLSNETLPALFSAPSMEDLMLTRLSNVKAVLGVKDRELAFFENRPLNLSAILRNPLYLPREAPLLLPPGITLRANFEAEDVDADVLGQSGVFSLILSGVSIPRRV